MPPKRYREGSPNTVLRSMSSEESGNSMNINLSQNTLNSRNNGYGGFSNNENGNLERTAKRRKNNSQPRPPLVTAAQAAGSKQKANYEKLRIKRNSLPRGLYNIFSNARLQNAVNQGRYQNMNTQIKSKIKLANNHERRIKNQLNKIPNGIFRRNTTFKINNVIGNNSKTNALLQQINTEQKKINANAKAKAAENAKKAAANKAAENAKKAAANKAAENAKKAVRNRVAPVNLRAKKKAAAAAQATENAKAKAENQEKNRKKAQNTINKAITNKRQRNANELNMLRKSKAAANKAVANKARANAKAKAATPANSVRNSVTNIGNGGNSLNNNANSSAFIAPTKRERKADGKLEKDDAGKFMKRGILLEIIKMSSRTINMANNNRNGFLKLMPTVNNANSILEYHTYTWALLYDLISTIDGTKFAALQITPKTLKDIHKKLMVKNTYTTGRSTGGMGNRQERVFNFTDEEVVEFLFLIWLDGNHDEYIHKSFIEWLDDKESNATYFTTTHRELAKKFVREFPDPRIYINNVPKFSKTNAKKEREEFITQALKSVKGYETIRKICIETESVWFFIHNYNGDPRRVSTKNQTSVKMNFPTFSGGNPSKTSLAGNFESILKMGIEKILNIKQSDYIYTGTWEINKLKQGNMIHEVSLDQESGDKILSKTITNTPKFRPYITTASLIDPGKHMLDSGAGSTDRLLLLNAMKTNNMNFLDNLQCHYHVGPVKFVIRNGSLNFLKVDLSIRKGGPPTNKPGKMPTLDFFQLKINETNRQSGVIKQGGKKAEAKNSASKMGKFMGDALQYMTVSVQNTYRGKPRYFASGDGSACFMNAYFCQKLKIPLRLIIDTGVSDIRSIGLRNN